MKIRCYLLTILLSITTQSHAQLTYLGPDKIDQKTTDGYRERFEASNLVQRNGKYYFSTPNGIIYQTDGTQSGTKAVFSLPGNELPVLAATQKYIYFSLTNTIISQLKRLQPEVKKSAWETVNEQGSSAAIKFNPIQVPGTRNRVDQMFVSPDQKQLFLRRFTGDRFYITYIADSIPNKTPNLIVGYLPIKNEPDMAIYASTQVAFTGERIYFNGYERNLLNRNTPAAFVSYSYIRAAAAPNGYLVNEYQYVRDRGYELKPGYFTSKSQLYAIMQKVEQPDMGSFHLLRFDKDMARAPASMPSKTPFLSAEEHEDGIYLIQKGAIKVYDAASERIVDVYTEPEHQWLTISGANYLAKSAGYLMSRDAKGLLMINMKNQQTTHLDNVEAFMPRNGFKGSEIFVYAAPRCFYIIRKNADYKDEFTQYNPNTKSYTPIGLPEFKNLKFSEIRAITQLDDRFIILARYEDKRGEAAYHMFMFKD